MFAAWSVVLRSQANPPRPQVDLEALLVKEIRVMTPADLNSEAQRCGVSLTAKGQEIAQIGKTLIERAKQQSNTASPPAK
jgi:hypothetical protein